MLLHRQRYLGWTGLPSRRVLHVLLTPALRSLNNQAHCSELNRSGPVAGGRRLLNAQSKERGRFLRWQMKMHVVTGIATQRDHALSPPNIQQKSLEFSIQSDEVQIHLLDACEESLVHIRSGPLR